MKWTKVIKENNRRNIANLKKKSLWIFVIIFTIVMLMIEGINLNINVIDNNKTSTIKNIEINITIEKIRI